MGVYAKCIYKTLRKLKGNSAVVTDIMKALMNLSSVDVVSMQWNLSINKLHKFK